MKRILSMILCICIIASTITLAASAVVNEICIFNITVEEPKVGNQPSWSAVVPTGIALVVTGMDWKGNFDVNGAFKDGEDYAVEITLQVAPYKENAIVTFLKGKAKINKKEAYKVSSSDDKQSLTIGYKFSLGSGGDSASTQNPTDTNTTTTTTKNTLNSPKATYDQLSVSEFEWEVLRLCNIERAKEGIDSLRMVGSLQSACDIREADLDTYYSHTRPNGEMPFTVISSNFSYSGAAENIAEGQRTPAEVVQDWMNSPGHRANIMNPDLHYMGVGFNPNKHSWVQLFAGGKAIKNVQTNAPSQNVPESEITKYYIAVQTTDGYLSYLPADYASMKQNGDKYYPRLNANSLPEFTKNQINIIPEPQISTFADVPTNAWFASAVQWAVERGITTGTSATTFSPDNTCTKAQIITFLWRAVGSPKIDGFNQFTDVKESDYFYHAALWASSKGMVSGNRFEPDALCTRSATVVYLWKNAGSPQASYEGNFTDVSWGTDYATAVAWAVSNGVTSGTSETTFSPNTTCTRGQIVTFLQRALK